MNRWRIFDTVDQRYMHIKYDTRASARRAADKMNRASKGVRYIVDYAREPMTQRKNIWPFGDSTKTTTVYRGRGVSSKSSGIRSALKYKGLARTASGVKYKGYHIWDDENGWHTSLDPGSWFDSKKDVTRLIDSWEKDRKNPLPLSAGSMILGPSEK